MNSMYVRARNVARQVGLTKVLYHLLPKTSYEEHFHKALVAGIRPGDVVWDVGANVGVYSEYFSQWVGENGSVVAFEPGEAACDEIRARMASCAWFRLEPVALGDCDGEGLLVLNPASSKDNQIKTEKIAADKKTADTVEILLRRADTVWRLLERTPNVVKVDVEGFELEVLNGFGDLLAQPELRGLYVEVHFAKLTARGMPNAPITIEKLLKSSGFEVKWVDSSHLVALR